MNAKPQNDLPHFMQSKAYAAFLQYHGFETVTIGTKSRPLYVSIRHVPVIGNLAKIVKAPWPIPFDEIHCLIQDRNLQLCRIEPNVILPQDPRVSKKIVDEFSQYNYQKTWLDCELATIRVDIRKSDDELLKSFPRENTRRNIRLALKDLIAEESDDLATFHQLHKALANKRHFYLPSMAELTALWESFRKYNDATIVLVRSKTGEVLTGVFILFFNNVAYYRYVGLANGAEKLRAPSFAVWQAMRTARDHGGDWFDFMSVNDERQYRKSFAGYSHFKAGFSTSTIRFVEPYAWYGNRGGQFLRGLDGLQRLFSHF